MRIGVIIAMDVEYRMMQEALGGDCGIIGHNEVVLWQCGIGKVNAAIGILRLSEKHSPDAILSTGLAGGIDAQLNVMDVLAASQSVYHDVWCGMGCEYGQVQGYPARYAADAHMLATAAAVAKNNRDGIATAFRTGLICTGDQFITDHTALQAIKERFPEGLACDMESAAIAQTCHHLGLPFLSLRIISDTPGRTDNHQQQWDDFLASMCGRSFLFVKQFLEAV